MDLGGWSSTGVRHLDEDAYLALDLSAQSHALGDLRAFLAISDGSGGKPSARVAQRIAIKTAQAYVAELLHKAAESKVRVDPKAALSKIFDRAARAVKTATAGEGLSASFTAVLVREGHAWVGHVGDSCIYVLRGESALEMTSEYSRFEPMVAEGEITWSEVLWNRGSRWKDNILRRDATEAELQDFGLDRTDALLLCTDGVSSSLSPRRMLVLASKAKSASGAARLLCDAAVAASGTHNMTAVLWAEDWEAFRAGVTSALRSMAPPGLLSTFWGRLVGLPGRAVLRVVGVVAVIALVVIGAWRLDPSRDYQQEPASAVTSTGSTVRGGVGPSGTVDPDTTSTMPAASTTSASSVITTTTEAPTTTLEPLTTTTTKPPSTTTTRRAATTTTRRPTTTTTTKPPSTTTTVPPTSTTRRVDTTIPPTTTAGSSPAID